METLKCTRCEIEFPSSQIKEIRKAILTPENNFPNMRLCSLCLDRTKKIYSVLKNFNIEEFMPYHDRMDVLLLTGLQTIRTVVGKPFIVHEAFATEGHSINSYHYKGQAVDGHFVEISLEDVYEKLSWWPGGIGVYSHWNNPGFHIDIGEKRRWWCDENGEYLKLSK